MQAAMAALAEAGLAGPFRQIPEDAHVRVGRVAVVEDDRGVREQTPIRKFHHPARRREPEETVAGLGVQVEVALLELLHEDPPCPWTIALGRPVVPDE
jgi:hypothetical protein